MAGSGWVRDDLVKKIAMRRMNKGKKDEMDYLSVTRQGTFDMRKERFLKTSMIEIVATQHCS